ncbi:hypothetical protein M0811_06376 [Anaeramoeba ignava]|uniref:BTB domain-containing protein n=1 Tax=Anaeramoeba ignava TaxID=1746090 RepID=A0A9Q0RDP5_ANAIG|nr:hypothetical protein M0811_06376 [Anaeramoeba ignava]
MNDGIMFDLHSTQIPKEMVELLPQIYSINEDLNKPNEIVQIALNFLYTGFPDFDHFLPSINKLINYKNQLNNLIAQYNSSFLSIFNYFDKRDEIEKLKQIEIDKYENENKVMEEFFQEMEFDSNWIELKKGRRGILKDLQKLYQNESTKDFTIICGEEEKEIKVHKLILIIRSELFKGMFLSVQDSSNQVHDYSGKSFETLNQLIYFLYHDEFNEKEINQEEFEDVKDYYQLNENSIIDFLLKDFI